MPNIERSKKSNASTDHIYRLNNKCSIYDSTLIQLLYNCCYQLPLISSSLCYNNNYTCDLRLSIPVDHISITLSIHTNQPQLRWRLVVTPSQHEPMLCTVCNELALTSQLCIVPLACVTVITTTQPYRRHQIDFDYFNKCKINASIHCCYNRK